MASPDVAAGAKRIVAKARLELIGSGGNTCSGQNPPGSTMNNGDRWCGFAAPFGIGKHELYVINVTKAAAGVAIDCTSGTDPNCKRLTQNLWNERAPGAGSPAYPFVHGFGGDTLLYYADATSPVASHFEGPVYAWRPGWAQGRQISSGKGWSCGGHGRTDVVICIDTYDATLAPSVTWNVIAGKLVDMPFPASQLPVVDKINASNTMSVAKYRHGFSRNGDYFMWSTGLNTTDKEQFWYWKLADGPVATAKKKVAGDMGHGLDFARWSVSYDQKRFYYYRGFNYDNTGAPRAQLWTANFPDITSPKMLAASVGGYALPFDGTETDKGIFYLQDVAMYAGNAFYIKNPTDAMPTPTLIENMVKNAGPFARDLNTVAYQKVRDTTVGGTGLGDKYLKKLVGTPMGQCPKVSDSTQTGGLSFLHGGGIMLWADQVDVTIGIGQGFYTTTADCMSTKFADGIDSWYVVGNQGFIFTDGSDGTTMNLKYVEVTNGNQWGTIKTIQGGIGVVFSTFTPEYNTVIYTIDSGTEGVDGIYIDATLPFTAVPST